MDGATDAELMVQVRQNDPEAFGLLVDRHKDALVNYLTRLTGSRDRGEEVAQEAFLRVYQNAGRYQEDGRFLPFLYRIATNFVRSEERRARRWRFVSGTFLGPAMTNAHEAPAAEARLLRSEQREVLQAALAELPLRLRAPLVLAAVEDWAYQDIARLLGCREGTVKSRIHRGRERLRASLQPYRSGLPEVRTT